MPKLSVIIPVYNVEKYLRECLDSVLAQSLTDMEVICIDDGSTDSSAEILANYAARDKRIRIITQENSGQAAARNVGIGAAKGDYLYFCDSDDILKGDFLGCMCDLCAEQQLDIVEFAREVFYEPGMALDPYEELSLNNGDYPDVLSGPEMFARQAKNRDFSVLIWLRVFRTAFLRQANLKFHAGVSCEDESFMLIALLSAKRVLRRKDVCYRRRVRSGSVMTGGSAKRRISGCLAAYEDIDRFLSANEMPADALRAAKRRLADLILSAGDAFGLLSEEEKATIAPFRGKTIPEHVLAADAFQKKCEAEDEKSNRTLLQRLLAPLKCLRENGLRYTVKRIFKRS